MKYLWYAVPFITAATLYALAWVVLATVGVGGPVTARYLHDSRTLLPKNVAAVRYTKNPCTISYSTTDAPTIMHAVACAGK
jgi:hypothetical protein